MQLAYSTNAFTRMDLRQAIIKVSKLGFAGIEILCDHPHWIPGKTSQQEAEEVALLLQEKNLTVSNLNVNTANVYFEPRPPENVFEPALSNTDVKLRKWRIQYSIDAIRLAKTVGAKCISVTSGRPMNTHLPQENLAHFIDSLKAICEAGHEHDIKIGIEYEPGLLVECADEVLEVIEKVGSPLLGVNFDIGHSYVFAEDPVTTVESLAGRIWNVHVEDIKGRKHYHLIPGEGNLPFDTYFQALKKANYNGFLTVELYSYPHQPEYAGQKALDYLKPLIP